MNLGARKFVLSVGYNGDLGFSDCVRDRLRREGYESESVDIEAVNLGRVHIPLYDSAVIFFPPLNQSAAVRTIDIMQKANVGKPIVGISTGAISSRLDSGLARYLSMDEPGDTVDLVVNEIRELT